MQQQHTCRSTSAVLYLWRLLAAHEHDSLNEARVFKKKKNSTAIISFQQFLSSVQTWNDKWIVCFRLESRQYLKGLWSLPQNPTTPRKTPRWTFVKAAAELISNHPPSPQKAPHIPSSWRLFLNSNYKSGSTVEGNCLTHFFSILQKITARLKRRSFITEYSQMWEFNTQGVTINLILIWS